MSQNDIIYLLKVKDHYEIVHTDVESNQPYKKVRAKTAEEALSKAQIIQEDTQAEYGVVINVMELKEL